MQLVRVYFLFFSSSGASTRFRFMPRASGVTQSHSLDTPQSVRLLWTSDQSKAETSTWQHTTVTRDKLPCPRRDWNSQSREAKNRTPTN